MTEEKKQKLDPLQWWEIFFLVTLAVGGFLWLRGPANSTAHLLFRLGINVVGVLGIIIILVVRYTRKNNKDTQKDLPDRSE